MCEVCLNNITFAYGSEPVLENISLQVAAKDFLMIFGPNGAGKSTVLKIIAGILAPDRGEVLINGQVAKAAVWLVMYRKIMEKTQLIFRLRSVRLSNWA